jgi:hypothetical protein
MLELPLRPQARYRVTNWTQHEASQAGLLVALDPGHLNLRHDAGRGSATNFAARPTFPVSLESSGLRLRASRLAGPRLSGICPE